MLIPYQQLTDIALNALIEDFVTRDGTDNGDDTPFITRIERVRNALKQNQAVIWFDSQTQQCQLCARHAVPKHLLEELDKESK